MFMAMLSNYEDRKIDHFECEELIIDTCAVNDSDQPYETAVSHLDYNNGEWIIVQLYDTIAEAQEGHLEWVKIMTAENLPDVLRDVSTATVMQFTKILLEEGEIKTEHKRNN